MTAIMRTFVYDLNGLLGAELRKMVVDGVFTSLRTWRCCWSLAKIRRKNVIT